MSPSGPEPRTAEPVGATVSATAVAGASAPTVTVRYWAAARAAVGTDSETRTGATVGEVVGAAVAAHPDLEQEGRDAPVVDGGTVEVLPPFAGG